MSRLCKASDLPRLDGLRAVVTGANSGLGLETARALAAAGAHVALACRDPERGRAALDALRAGQPEARLELRLLDLARLDAVREAADALARDWPHLDLLVNNAGVMALPRGLTADGFERQLGTNHLGHFAFTLRLLPLLRAAPAPRVVTLTSLWQHLGRLDLDDLHGARRYHPWRAYGQSKLANTVFACELARRAPWLLSLSAHPGYAATPLHVAGPRMAGAPLREALMRLGAALFAQRAARGALPSLLAATDPAARAADQYVPAGPLQLRGCARRSRPPARALDPATGEALWAASEDLTRLSL